MKHRPRLPEQDDLLRPRLVDMIDPRHELVKLAAAQARVQGVDEWERQLLRKFRPLSADLLCKSPAGQRSKASSSRSRPNWSGEGTGRHAERSRSPCSNTSTASTIHATSTQLSAGNHSWSSNKGPPNMRTWSEQNRCRSRMLTVWRRHVGLVQARPARGTATGLRFVPISISVWVVIWMRQFAV